MKKIRYFFEYKCSPIWIYDEDMEVDNIDITELPINTYLKEEIIELDRLYQETYNDDYPAESLHNDKIRNYIFTKRAIESAKLLKKELGENFSFFYYLIDMECLFEESKKLELEIFGLNKI